MIHPDLQRSDTNEINEDKSEIRLFAVMQNEELRLPFYLNYYRRIGVSRFFIVDNNSQDDTGRLLLAQPDCHVFYAAASYEKSRFGVNWLNPLLEAFGDGHWIVIADADELLVFPRCEQKTLREFCTWLDAHDYQGIYTTLLDMYSALPLRQVRYEKGQDFRAVCNYFDRDYHFVRRLGIPFLMPPFPKRESIGGPRLRLCFPRQNTQKMWPRVRIKLMRRLMNLIQRAGFMKSLEVENVAPQAFKIPLVKWKHGYGYITSHRLNPIRLAPITGVLMHFKYFQDFGARVQDATTRLNHYDSSAEYKRYAEMIIKNSDLSMMYAGSVPYRDSTDLVKLRLMESDPEWEKQ